MLKSFWWNIYILYIKYIDDAAAAADALQQIYFFFFWDAGIHPRCKSGFVKSLLLGRKNNER